MSQKDPPTSVACLPAAVRPHDGWGLHDEPWGYMSTEAQHRPGTELVRLAHVLAWLEGRLPGATGPGMASDLALQKLTAKLANDGAGSLFVTSTGAPARPVSDGMRFVPVAAPAPRFKPTRGGGFVRGCGGLSTQQAQRAAVAASAGHQAPKPPTPQPVPVNGLPGLLAALEAGGPGRLNDPRQPVAWVAVLVVTAHRLWGYGERVAPPAPAQAQGEHPADVAQAGPKAGKAAPPGPLTWQECCEQRKLIRDLGLNTRQATWTDEQCMALAREFLRLEGLKGSRPPGALTTIKQIQEDIGVKWPSLRGHLERGEELLKKQQEQQKEQQEQAEKDRILKNRSVFGG